MFVDIINFSWHYISGREILVRSFGGRLEELDWLFERKQDNQTHWWYRLFHDGSQARGGPWYSGVQEYKETVLLVGSSYMMDAWCFLRAKAIIKRKDLIHLLNDSLKKSKPKHFASYLLIVYTNTLLDCCCLIFLPTAKNKRFSLSLCTKTWSSLCSCKIYIYFALIFWLLFLNRSWSMRSLFRTKCFSYSLQWKKCEITW